MMAGDLPWSLRAARHWNALKSRGYRRLGITFDRWAEWCMRRTSARRETAQPHRQTKARLTWQALLTQVGSPDAVRLLLEGRVVGHDLPRGLGVPDRRRILVIAAHQDDELIGAGGTFLLCRDRGAEFRVVYYTDGATSFGDLDEADTVRIRRHEGTLVWRELAGVTPDFWDYPNRAFDVTPEAAERLAAAIAEFQPDAIFLPSFFEQPVEHRRMNELLWRADALQPLRADIDVWGYQITTRVPGNAVVDVTSVWQRKYALNQKWVSQNTSLDYAHLAMGQDIANAYFLKGRQPKDVASHAEVFVSFRARDYLKLLRTFMKLPATPAMLAASGGEDTAPNFFIIGMQKSGSYWLTALLDAHPQVRCFPSRPNYGDGTGEAHLFDSLARLDTDFAGFRKSMRAKLDGHFKDLIPPEPPATLEAREAVLADFRARFNQFCQLQRLKYGKPVVGEKTTETVHHLDLVEAMYPGVAKICILRDPRDRVMSFFYHQVRKRRVSGEAGLDAAFVDEYIARVRQDYAGLLGAREPIHVLLYEQLQADPHGQVAALLRFLGVRADGATVTRVVTAGSFERLSGRRAGREDVSSHYRRGVTGDWRGRLPEGLAARMVEALDAPSRRLEERFGLDLGVYRSH